MSQAATNKTMVDSLGADVANLGGWTKDTILLVLGYSKTERYFPYIRQNLDQFWPGRPRTLFVTDGDAVGEDVLRGKDCTFLELLSTAVTAVRERFPTPKHVFLLLEDLCPFGPVDEAKLARAQALLRRNNSRYLCHIWDRKENGIAFYDYLDGPDSLQDEDVLLYSMDRKFPHPNSLVAAFWEIDHLEDVITAKRTLNLHDPWSFELPLADQPDDHFMYSGSWPVWKDGFFVNGELNVKAITRKVNPNSPLLSQLRKEYCGVNSYHAAALKRSWCKLGHSIRKRVGRKSDTSLNPMPTDRRR